MSSSAHHEASHSPATEMTNDEAELYDRQIRLWGLDAQNMLRSSSVLVYGLSGLGSEVVKNLMLCGLKSLTIMDDKQVTEDDYFANFLLEENKMGENRAESSAAKARTLNPMVAFKVEVKSIEELEAKDLDPYDLLILADQPYPIVEKWDNICRELKMRFIAGGVYGWTGYAFFDFDGYQFLMKQKPKDFNIVGLDDAPSTNAMTTIEDDVFEKEVLSYPSFADAFNFEWKEKKFARKAKRLVPISYAPIRAQMRAEQGNLFNGDEANDREKLVELFRKEVELVNHEPDMYSVPESDFDYYFNPQFSPVCSTVGGMIGQEAIKALSEAANPLRNVFLYSAFTSSGHVARFPPE